MPDNDIEQRIRERAFCIWIEQGRPESKDREHWQQAEGELMAGIAVPESQVEATPHGQAESVSDPFDQIKYAAARDLDQGGMKLSPTQPRSGAQSWDSYQSAAQSWDHYKQRCGGY